MACLPTSSTTVSILSSSSISTRSESDQQMRSALSRSHSLSNASSQLSKSPRSSELTGAGSARMKVERSCAESEQQETSGPVKKVYTSKKIVEKAFHVFEDLRKNGQLCDVIIRVGEHDYAAHRVVLAATSPYFQAMFTSEFFQK